MSSWFLHIQLLAKDLWLLDLLTNHKFLVSRNRFMYVTKFLDFLRRFVFILAPMLKLDVNSFAFCLCSLFFSHSLIIATLILKNIFICSKQSVQTLLWPQIIIFKNFIFAHRSQFIFMSVFRRLNIICKFDHLFHFRRYFP